MSKLKLFAVLAATSAAFSMFAWGQQAPEAPSRSPDELPGLMRAKLASSQKVVEGLMAKDFDLIRKGADEMAKICDATAWPAIDDEVYAQYHAEMRRTAKKMRLLAEERNFDGAVYTYMHSLTTCISCHDYSREVLHVADEIPDLQAVPVPSTEQDNAQERKPNLRR